MTLAELGRVFEIKPAVHFLGVAGGDVDPHKLVGLVKDEEELAKMGADHMAGSVIYVDTAYDVQNGFVGVPLPPCTPPPRERASSRSVRRRRSGCRSARTSPPRSPSSWARPGAPRGRAPRRSSC